MQWNAGPNAGFTAGKPWFYVNPNYRRINAEAQERDPESILNFYRRCLRLRKESATLLWGSYREYFPRSRHLYVYERRHRGERILVLCSFSGREQGWRLPKGYAREGAELLLSNYTAAGDFGRLRPWETRVYRWKQTE